MIARSDYKPKTFELATGLCLLEEQPEDDGAVTFRLSYRPRGGGLPGFSTVATTPSLSPFGTTQVLDEVKMKFVENMEERIADVIREYYHS